MPMQLAAPVSQDPDITLMQLKAQINRLIEVFNSLNINEINQVDIEVANTEKVLYHAQILDYLGFPWSHLRY